MFLLIVFYFILTKKLKAFCYKLTEKELKNTLKNRNKQLVEIL